MIRFMDGANVQGAGAVFFVPGRPRTKGSFKTTRTGGVRPDNPDSIEMQERIRREAVGHWPPRDAVAGPIAVKVTCYFARPKSHYGTGRNAGKLKDSAPPYPISKGRNDLDKLLRLIFDAMSGIVYEDDSQVCRIGETEKLYIDGTQPLEGVLIGVRTL